MDDEYFLRTLKYFLYVAIYGVFLASCIVLVLLASCIVCPMAGVFKPVLLFNESLDLYSSEIQLVGRLHCCFFFLKAMYKVFL